MPYLIPHGVICQFFAEISRCRLDHLSLHPGIYFTSAVSSTCPTMSHYTHIYQLRWDTCLHLRQTQGTMACWNYICVFVYIIIQIQFQHCLLNIHVPVQACVSVIIRARLVPDFLAGNQNGLEEFWFWLI